MTLRSALRRSNRFGPRQKIRVMHISKPIFDPNVKYLIVARSPIKRALSAFNWRQKLVVHDRVQEHRFPGEYQVLVKYKTLNHLAEQLYDRNGKIVSEVQEDFFKIHHLRENISFYLTDFLQECGALNIFCVLMKESLAADIKRHLGVELELRKNNNPSSYDLTAKAERHLRRFLHLDYEALIRLYCWGFISPETMKEIV